MRPSTKHLLARLRYRSLEITFGLVVVAAILLMLFYRSPETVILGERLYRSESPRPSLQH